MLDWHAYEDVLKRYYLIVTENGHIHDEGKTLYDIYTDIENDEALRTPDQTLQALVKDLHWNKKAMDVAKFRKEHTADIIEHVNKALCETHKFSKDEQHIISCIAIYSVTEPLDKIMEHVGRCTVQEFSLIGNDIDYFENKISQHQLALCASVVEYCLEHKCDKQKLDMLLRGTTNHHGFNPDGTGNQPKKDEGSTYFVARDDKGADLWNEYNLIAEIAHCFNPPKENKDVGKREKDIKELLKYIPERAHNKPKLLPDEDIMRSRERIQYIVQYVKSRYLKDGT